MALRLVVDFEFGEASLSDTLAKTTDVCDAIQLEDLFTRLVGKAGTFESPIEVRIIPNSKIKRNAFSGFGEQVPDDDEYVIKSYKLVINFSTYKATLTKIPVSQHIRENTRTCRIDSLEILFSELVSKGAPFDGVMDLTVIQRSEPVKQNYIPPKDPDENKPVSNFGKQIPDTDDDDAYWGKFRRV